MSKPRYIDLTGQRFGHFLVVGLQDRSKGYCKWSVQCECGKSRCMRTNTLRKGVCKECSRPYISGVNNGNFVDMTGQKVGRWTVLGIDQVKDKRIYWRCACECGNTKSIATKNLREEGSTRSCGCLKREKRNLLRGERHPRWNPDRESVSRKRQDPVAIVWRNNVLKRDGYQCQISGQQGGDLCAHHIASWDQNPALRYDINNGITVAYNFHVIFHRMFGYGKNTREQFDQFVRWMELLDVKTLAKSWTTKS